MGRKEDGIARRFCHKCKLPKPHSAFARLPDGTRRFYSWCDPCRADETGRRVYVVLLDDAAGKRRNPRYPLVYVGQSVRPPEDRFAQHLAGYKKSKYVHKYGVRLIPRLYRSLPTYYAYETVLSAERDLKRRLDARGYTAYGGH